MTPGTMVMYLLHLVLTSDKRHLGDIVDAHGRIDTAQSLGLDTAQRCRQKMQLAFAANLYVGRFPVGDSPPTEQSEDSVDLFSRALRRNNGPRGQRLRAQQEEEERRGRDPRPSRKNKKRDNKRENKKERKKARKHDRKRGRE